MDSPHKIYLANFHTQLLALSRGTSQIPAQAVVEVKDRWPNEPNSRISSLWHVKRVDDSTRLFQFAYRRGMECTLRGGKFRIVNRCSSLIRTGDTIRLQYKLLYER